MLLRLACPPTILTNEAPHIHPCCVLLISLLKEPQQDPQWCTKKLCETYFENALMIISSDR